MVQRLSAKNPIMAKNFIGKYADQRRDELQKARQNFQQNSFLVDSPPILYYQQIKNGYTCTCHAMNKPEEQPSLNYEVSPDLKEYSDVSPKASPTEVTFSTLLKSPLFGTMPTEPLNSVMHEEDYLLDDSDETTESSASPNPLFPNLFHKGVDCGICFRTGFTPLLQPIGSQFYSLTTHTVSSYEGYMINQTSFPNSFEKKIDNSYVAFDIKVPKFFSKMRYRIYNNVTPLDAYLYIHGERLTQEWINISKGTTLEIQVREDVFTHVFLEFDFGIDIHANFPQFSISKDYTSFFNLQSITIELPPVISNPQVNDIVYVPSWERMWMVFDIQPFYEGPFQDVLIKTSVQGRLIQNIETQTILKKLKLLER